ncbi:MAG: hypothetical protein K8M05_33445, partial [Deltaproteobacteria bacterium]|nr:hypothetical protein [Kofleriaceae bacterium]
MLGKDVALHHIEPRHWQAWFELLVPPAVRTRPRWALAILDDDRLRVLKLVVAGHDAKGAVDPGLLTLPPTQAHLRECAKRLEVGAVIVLEVGALASVSAEVEPLLSLDMDLAAQGLALLRALKARSNRGVWSEPPLLDLLPAPAFDPLQKTFDLLVPDDSALAAYVIADDRKRVAASVIAVKRGGDIAEVSSHAALAGDISEAALARDWGVAYKRVNRAIADRFAKPCVSVFIERATVDKLIVGPPDTLGRELNAKRLVIDPAPAWLLGLLGGA